MLDTGAYIGMVVGFLSGFITAKIIFIATNGAPNELSGVVQLYMRVAAVPMLMFGGEHISSDLLADKWDTLFDSYVKWMVIVFFVVVVIPAIVWMYSSVKEQIKPTVKHG